MFTLNQRHPSGIPTIERDGIDVARLSPLEGPGVHIDILDHIGEDLASGGSAQALSKLEEAHEDLHKEYDSLYRELSEAEIAIGDAAGALTVIADSLDDFVTDIEYEMGETHASHETRRHIEQIRDTIKKYLQ